MYFDDPLTSIPHSFNKIKNSIFNGCLNLSSYQNSSKSAQRFRRENQTDRWTGLFSHLYIMDFV